MQHVETGAVVFVGLHALLIWRFLAWSCCGSFMIKCCGKRFEFAAYLNYTVMLYMLLLVMLVYVTLLYFEDDIVASILFRYFKQWFGKSIQQDVFKHTEAPTSGGSVLSLSWLPLFCKGAIIAVCITYVLSFLQALQHLDKMRRGRAAAEHDRAIQVIALPAVYGVMAMSSMSEMSQLVRSGAAGDVNMVRSALSRSEACFRVGDLYEAWVLHQFGILTLTLILSSIRRQESSIVEGRAAAAKGLLVAHDAVESLMWLGTWMFVVVCVLQSGWSLWMLTFASTSSQESFESTNAQFTAAGMVASASAIWNVHTVESTYYNYLQGYSPYIKFVSVKILVSFAFFQRGAFWFLQAFQKTLPGVTQGVVSTVPFIGDVLRLSEVEGELFYAALILYEILFVAVLHIFAWKADEEWYLDFYHFGWGVDREAGQPDECRPLLGPTLASRSTQTSWPAR
eukprot:TRINITY_DN68546_c0_g1_i1.p1 TRINITY_DN68546_c0_g1~~TRINITY_DN68546_c0_g1_i1.p1  ORF type:complete len:483 (-),score=41.84 TRINITY_DN68546_c0_g1_i1:47-1405(-)